MQSIDLSTVEQPLFLVLCVHDINYILDVIHSRNQLQKILVIELEALLSNGQDYHQS
jgi:hypothetical protein